MEIDSRQENVQTFMFYEASFVDPYQHHFDSPLFIQDANKALT